MLLILQRLLLILVFSACLVAWTQARSISRIGDVYIDTAEDKFICDKIECPVGAELCVVSKEKDPNNSTVLLRKNICYSEKKEVLLNSVTYETVNANAKVQFRIVASRSGLISNAINSFGANNFDVESFNREMSSFQQNLHQELNNVNREISNLGVELGNIFD